MIKARPKIPIKTKNPSLDFRSRPNRLIPEDTPIRSINIPSSALIPLLVIQFLRMMNEKKSKFYHVFSNIEFKFRH